MRISTRHRKTIPYVLCLNCDIFTPGDVDLLCDAAIGGIIATKFGLLVAVLSDALYENDDLYGYGGCFRICIRSSRVIHLMLDVAYAYASQIV
jgi:hypothetical protein